MEIDSAASISLFTAHGTVFIQKLIIRVMGNRRTTLEFPSINFIMHKFKYIIHGHVMSVGGSSWSKFCVRLYERNVYSSYESNTTVKSTSNLNVW